MPNALLAALIVLVSATTVIGQTPDSILLSQTDDRNLYSDSSVQTIEPSYSGLFGRRYIDVAYSRFDIGRPTNFNSEVILNGVDGKLNLPLSPVSDWLPYVGVDAFANLTRHKLADRGEPLYMTLSNFAVGTSIYYDEGNIRPFVQVGMNFWSNEVGAKTAPIVFKENDTELLLNFGLEAEMGPTVAFRSWIDANPRIFDKTGFHTDLIWWPHDRCFVRGGIGIGFSDQDSGRYSTNIGGGWTF